MKEGHVIGQPAPLIREIKMDEIKALKEKFAGRSKAASPPKAVAPEAGNTGELEAQVTAQGDEVRKLKESKADKDVIKAAVDKLLELKKQLALAQGKDPNEGSKVNNKKGGKKK